MGRKNRRNSPNTVPVPANEQRSFSQAFSIKSGDSFLPGDLGFSPAGVQVNHRTALQSSAVYAAVRLISQIIACLDIQVMRRMGDDVRVDRDHKLHRLLNETPNDLMHGFTFKEVLTQHVLLHGNGYAYIRRDPYGEPDELMLLNPEMTTAKMANGRLSYFTEVGGKPFELTPDKVFHLVGFSHNGITGVSPIKYAGAQIGVALAADKFSAKYFANNTVLAGILKSPMKLTDPAKHNLRESINLVHQGSDNAFRFLLLEQNMEWQPVEIDAESSQLLEARKYSVVDIARLFGLPPHSIGDLEHSWATIEQESIHLVKYSLRPWFERWESEGDRKLFLEADKSNGYFLRFDIDDLLRGEVLARYQAYHQGLADGWLNFNEVRRQEGLPPINGGDQHYRPMNMTTVSDDSLVPSETLGGPQLQSMANIVAMVTNKAIPRESGVELLALMGLEDAEAEKVIGPAGKSFEPQTAEKPAPVVEQDKTEQVEPVAKDEPAPNLKQDIQTDPASVLNGAQVTAALDIVNQVSQGLLAKAAAIGMLEVFFNLSPEQSAKILGPVVEGSQPGTAPDAAELPDQNPDEPDEATDDAADDEQDEPADVARYQGLVVDAIQRALTKECNAVRRAAKKHRPDSEAFQEWAGEFYTDHAELLRRNLAPVADVANLDDAQINTFVARYCDDAKRDLAGIDNDKLTDVLARWETKAVEAVELLRGNQCQN